MRQQVDVERPTSRSTYGAAWTASTWTSVLRPRTRRMVRIRSCRGWTVPTSLLAAWSATRMVRSSSAASSVLGVEATVAVDRQDDDLEAELLEVPERVEHRVVLDGAGQDAVAAPLACPGRALDGQVDRLGAAGREDDLARLGAEGRGRTSCASSSAIRARRPGRGPTTDCRSPRSAAAASPRAPRGAGASWRRGQGRWSSSRAVARHRGRLYARAERILRWCTC